MRVLAAKAFPSEQRMEVYVELPEGTVKVPVTWKAKLPQPTPPSFWLDLVRSEISALRASRAPGQTIASMLGGR